MSGIGQSAADAARTNAASIEFFAIELGRGADGQFFVGINATCCEDAELFHVDLGNHRVASLDDAFAVKR